MDAQPGMDPQQMALARAGQLTTELIDLVRALRAAVADGGERPAPEPRPASARLQPGDLRAAMGRANRRSSRQVPHLLG